MNDAVTIAADGFLCGLCGAQDSATTFPDAALLADTHFHDAHHLRWAEVAPYRLRLVANGTPFAEAVRPSVR